MTKRETAESQIRYYLGAFADGGVFADRNVIIRLILGRTEISENFKGMERRIKWLKFQPKKFVAKDSKAYQ